MEWNTQGFFGLSKHKWHHFILYSEEKSFLLSSIYPGEFIKELCVLLMNEWSVNIYSVHNSRQPQRK